MTISYPLTLPTTPGATQIKLYQKSSVAVNESPWTNQSQVQEHQGKKWGAQITLPPMDREDAEPWLVWLLQLNGMAGTFLLGDPLGGEPQGSWIGSPVVSGAGQTGSSLNISGLVSGATIIPGDYIQLGQRLYKNISTSIITVGGGGTATLDIFPSLRESPGDGETVVTIGAKGLFRLDSNSNNLYDLDELEYYSCSFSAIEAV